MNGWFGIGIVNPKNADNVGTLWRSADLLGASFIFTIGRRYRRQPSDTAKSWRNIPLWHYNTFAQFLESKPKDGFLIGIEICEKAKDIKTFCHPKQAVYLLGAEDWGISEDIQKQCNYLVKIPGRFSFNVSSAGTIVMYDRYMKE